jgi:hypothetical protein
VPRGGRRAGAPGKAYPNRTDLSVNKGPVPNQPYPMSGSQGYGEQKAMMDSQRAMPVSSPAAPGPAGPPGMPVGQPGPAPGSWGAFNRPTERPNEPITHGLPNGPGGGPEVMTSPAVRPAMTLLQQMAAQPYASDELRTLLNILQR